MTQSAYSRTMPILYSGARDVQSHRIRLVLAAKGVRHERVIVEPTNLPEQLLSLNPDGDLPTLVDRDLTLYDPSVLCDYLDERYPHPALMPVDPLSRARLRLTAVRIERDWLSEVKRIETHNSTAALARKRLRKRLLAAQPLFRASRFFLNEEMSLLDCLVAPIIWRLPSLGIDMERDGKSSIHYGERLFHTQGYTRSLTPEEKAMR